MKRPDITRKRQLEAILADALRDQCGCFDRGDGVVVINVLELAPNGVVHLQLGTIADRIMEIEK